jgi:predicted permease
MRRFFKRLSNAFRGERSEEEAAREIAAHLALLEDEYRRRGMAADEARLAARRALGSVALAKDLHRDARSFVWVEDLRRDLRLAVRTLRRTPGFTAVAIIALGLGIGVNTTFFTIVNAICLRGLPIDSPERVMYLSTRVENRTGFFSYAEFDDLRARTTTFGEVAGYTLTGPVISDARQPPALVSGAFVSSGAFELLGDRPLVGRTFRADEDRPGSPQVVILGGEIWASRYASDPGIVGESITVNGIPTTVIGVMPRGFMFPSNADVWRPMANLPTLVRESRAERRITVIARLADGATEDQGRSDLSAIAAAWSGEFPATNRDVGVQMVGINEQLNPSVAQREWIAFIVVGVLVLLVACANVANLLLMRSAARGREMAIRTSIGATRGRVVRQLLVESATLAALAGAVGVLMAWAGLRVLSGIVPPETLPYWMAFTIDGRVLAVVLIVCLGSVFLCGLPAALHLSKVDLRDTLTDNGTTTVARPARRWIAALLAAEFAVTLVLVALAVSGVRSSLEARRTEFQIDPTSLATMWVTLPADLYATPAARARFFEQLDASIAGSTGIRAAAFASALPYGGGSQQPMAISGRTPADPMPLVSVVLVSERYFAALGIPMVRGRSFTDADGRPGAEAAIVNQRFVRMFLDGHEPIGARLRVGGGDRPWLEIVGVATTVRQQLIGSQPDPVVFLPFRHAPSPVAAILIRSTGDPAGPIATLRNEVARIKPNLPLYRVMTFEQAVRNAVWNSRLSNVVVSSIAVAAFVLALIGLYAVTGHTVERWTRELGLRVALGASAAHIVWLVLRRVLTQLAIGLAVGLMATQAFDRLFSGPVDPSAAGIRISDLGPLTLIVVSITAVAIVACLVPIRRAARVDPIDALRAS